MARISGLGRKAVLQLEQLFVSVILGIEGLEIELPDFENVVETYENPTPGNTRVFKAKGMRAVLIIGEECDILLSLGSARKLDIAGDNAFVEALIEVLDSGDYDKVVTTTISRLCRNTILSGEIARVLESRRTTILAGPYEIKVWEPTGNLLWNILVWVAQLEAELIEARLTAGKIVQAENGEWNFGFPPPPGWDRLEGGSVVVDEDAAAAVRWLIEQVLAGETSWRRMARGVASRWPDLKARRGGGRLAGNQEPGTNLRRSYLNETWFEAYVTDMHEVVFVPDAVKQRIDRAVEEGRDPSADEAIGAELISSVVFKLPPQPRPIATRAEIEQLNDRLAEMDGQRPRRRRTGSSLWTGLRWSFRQVTVESDSSAGSSDRVQPDETEAA